MLYEIIDGTVTVGQETVLRHIHFEIHGTEKIAVVGRNGAGKTTLLRLIGGVLSLDRDDHRNGPGIRCSRTPTVGLLSQNVFENTEQTVEEYMKEGCIELENYSREMYEYEREFDKLFTGLGFFMADKQKRIREFSGGERTKLGFIRLFLQKPDILLLDEPTNHMDIEAVEWLEQYMKGYNKAVVMVSHDRFFLDQTAEVVYELSEGKLYRYPGNYTAYREEKQKRQARALKAYARQQDEIARQNALIERFKHKPKKAAFARSRKKMLERMEKLPKPAADECHLFTGDIIPELMGSKWVFECEHLKIGYERPLLELTWRIRRGQKIGLIGPNGAGKTTFLKTVVGKLAALSGRQNLGNDITVGYFDQHSAQIDSEKMVADHFHDQFPSMSEKEVRQTLAAYLFGGAMASRRVKDLSGGEKARLVLCELLCARPNFLVLDEPTNHMDIPARETLEAAFLAYKGTILFISHDRYFTARVASEILIFEKDKAAYYPFGYAHYIERKRQAEGGGLKASIDAADAALIEGLRAVPKPERHRLREIDTEEAYDEWRLRLAGEAMAAAGEAAREAWEKWQASLAAYREGPDIFEGGNRESEADIQLKKAAYEAAAGKWQESCCGWFDVHCESREGEFSGKDDEGGAYENHTNAKEG